MRIKNKEYIDDINSLFVLCNEHAVMSELIKALKDKIKDKYKDTQSVQTDDVICFLKDKNREYAPIKNLRAGLGQKAEQFIQKSLYKSISLEKLNKD